MMKETQNMPTENAQPQTFMNEYNSHEQEGLDYNLIQIIN